MASAISRSLSKTPHGRMRPPTPSRTETRSVALSLSRCSHLLKLGTYSSAPMPSNPWHDEQIETYVARPAALSQPSAARLAPTALDQSRHYLLNAFPRRLALTAAISLFGPLGLLFSMDRLGGVVVGRLDLLRWRRGRGRGNTRGGLFVATATARHESNLQVEDDWYLRREVQRRLELCQKYGVRTCLIQRSHYRCVDRMTAWGHSGRGRSGAAFRKSRGSTYDR